MNNKLPLLLVLINLFLSNSALAQLVSLNDADALFDFAETVEPGLFSPPSTTDLSVAGWTHRYYAGTDTYAAVNLTDGGVYVLGGSFGNEVVFVNSLANLIGQVNGESPPPASGAMVNPGNGNCIELPLPPTNLQASYQITTFDGGTPSFRSNEQRILEASNSKIVLETITRSNDTTGETINTVVTTTNFEIFGDTRFQTDRQTLITVESPLGIATQSIDTRFNPSLLIGPASTFCTGMQWVTTAVGETRDIVSQQPGQAPVMETINAIQDGRNATVLANFDKITTAEGETFTAQKFRDIFVDNSSAITWTDVTTGQLIRLEFSDETGTLVTRVELALAN